MADKRDTSLINDIEQTLSDYNNLSPGGGGMSMAPAALPVDGPYAYRPTIGPAVDTGVPPDMSNPANQLMQPDQAVQPVSAEPGADVQPMARPGAAGFVPTAPPSATPVVPGYPPQYAPKTGPYAAPAPAPAPSGPGVGGPTDNFGEVRQNMADQLDLQDRYFKAQMEADQAHAKAMGEAKNKEVEALANLQKDYQMQRALNERAAAEHAADFAKRYDEALKAQPDPQKYFGEGGMGVFRRLMWFASIFAGAKAMSYGAKENLGLNMMISEIDKNVQLQKEALSRQIDKLKTMRGDELSQEKQQMADLVDDRGMRYQMLNVVGQQLEAKAMAPGPADQKAAYLKMLSGINDARAKTLMEIAKEKETALNKDLDRKKDIQVANIKEYGENHRQQITQANENARALLREQGENERAQIKVGEAGEKARAERAANQTELSPTLSGFHLKDPKTGKTVRGIVTDKAGAADAMRLGAQAAQTFRAHEVLAKAVNDDSELTQLLKSDPAARKAAWDIASSDLKAKFGRVNETELENEMVNTGGFTGPMANELKTWLSGNKDRVKEYVISQRDNYAKDIARQAFAQHDANQKEIDEKGYIPVFVPPSVEAPKAPTITADERSAQLGRTDIAPRSEPKTLEDYQKAKARGELPPLPAESQRALDEFQKGFERKTPDRIRKDTDAAVDLLKQGKLSTATGVEIPEGQRATLISRVKQESKLAIKDSEKRVENLVEPPTSIVGRAKWGVIMGDEDKFRDEAAREGFEVGLNITADELDDLWKEAKRRYGVRD